MRYKKSVLLSTVVSLGLAVTAAFAPAADAQSWTPSGPVDRTEHSAVLDTITSTMIVFGGATFDNTWIDLNDVWWLSPVGSTNINWTQVNPLGTPPAPRTDHTAVYDSGSNEMIVFGGGLGFTSPCVNDVWILQNANGADAAPTAWSQLIPVGVQPAGRHGHKSVYDPVTNSMIVFGGNDCFSTTFGDLWVLSNANGLGGTPMWTLLAQAGGGPGPRQDYGVAYDATNNVLMLVGGPGPAGGTVDAWVLSHANGQGGVPTWTQLAPTGARPPARGGLSATYDPNTNRLTIFGGGDAAGNLMRDAWVLTNANGLGGTPSWSQIAGSSTLFPAHRSQHSAVYDPTSNQMTIFGGHIAFTSPISLSNDVWVLGNANGLVGPALPARSGKGAPVPTNSPHTGR